MGSDSLNRITTGLTGASRTVSEVVNSAVPGTGGSGGTAEQFTQLADQLQQLQTISQAETQSIEQNTQAVTQNTTLLGQTGTSTAGRVGSALEGGLGLGTGLSPLLSGLISLFGGGGTSQPAELTRFSLPPSISVNVGMTEGAPTQPFGVDYAAGGQARPSSSSSGQQITVQVQALDSQSFLDHSQDIAQAVRQAMLESSVLNDVIQDAVS